MFAHAMRVPSLFAKQAVQEGDGVRLWPKARRYEVRHAQGTYRSGSGFTAFWAIRSNIPDQRGFYRPMPRVLTRASC